MIHRETIALLIKMWSKAKATAVARPVTNTIRKKLSNEAQPNSDASKNDLWEMEKPSISSKKMAYGRLRQSRKNEYPID